MRCNATKWGTRVVSLVTAIRLMAATTMNQETTPSNVSYRDGHRSFYHSQNDGACEIVASTCLLAADKVYIVSRSAREVVVGVLFRAYISCIR